MIEVFSSPTIFQQKLIWFWVSLIKPNSFLPATMFLIQELQSMFAQVTSQIKSEIAANTQTRL